MPRVDQGIGPRNDGGRDNKVRLPRVDQGIGPRNDGGRDNKVGFFDCTQNDGGEGDPTACGLWTKR